MASNSTRQERHAGSNRFDDRFARTTGDSQSGATLQSEVEMGSLQEHGRELLVSAPLLVTNDRPAIVPEVARRRLSLGIEGTYLNDVLTARDSALTRWPERVSHPLRVFIRDAEELDGWNHDFMTATRDAFDTWVQAGVPLKFTFVVDSASADIQVHFVNSFPTGISGRTVWSRDSSYWLVAGDIQLALSHPGGGVLTPPQMRAIALHEVGHLIGLDHATDSDQIMSARVRVRDLTEADRATARLVYSVPAGSIK